MHGAILDAMNRGLHALEGHPLVVDEPSPQLLARFEMHALAFAEGFGRLLERRVARDIDRDIPSLSAIARFHLRLHSPLARGLQSQLVSLGRSRAQLDALEVGPKTRACLDRAHLALEVRDPHLSHILLVQGLECMTQFLSRRGMEIAFALGGKAAPFEQRHHGHEDLLFLGLDALSAAAYGANVQAKIVDELDHLFADAEELLEEWRSEEPGQRRRSRTRRRAERWGTNDLPNDVA